MYFNRYTPATKSENLETARAQMVYNAVSRFCGKAEPRAKDYAEYRFCKLTNRQADEVIGMADGWYADCVNEWAEIRKLVREAGQPLHDQHVVYFSIISGGVKPGETKNLVQRYCDINRATPIQKMWYMEVANKAQALAAEHALHVIFDHARCMNRQQNKKDYYECDADRAQKFITANAKEIYEAVMEAIEGI